MGEEEAADEDDAAVVEAEEEEEEEEDKDDDDKCRLVASEFEVEASVAAAALNVVGATVAVEIVGMCIE